MSELPTHEPYHDSETAPPCSVVSRDLGAAACRPDAVSITPERRRQILKEVREARRLVDKLTGYVIPSIRCLNTIMDDGRKKAAIVTVLPFDPIVHDPDSPFQGGYRPFTRTRSDDLPR